MDDLFNPDERHGLDYVSLDKIVPNNWNANEEDEATFDALVDDVSETGFIDSLTVVPMENGTYRIIGGEHRWMAAKASGSSEVPCLILKGEKWRDEDLQKFVTVRMNVIRGKLNPEKFARLYEEMAEKYGAEQLQKMFGFVDKRAFKKLVKGVTKAAKQSLPKELHGEMVEKAKDAKTVDDLSTIVQEMYQKYGDTVSKSYMIFTHGKQEHIYVQMDQKMRRAMDKVILYIETAGVDINDFMAPVVKACLKEAMAKLEQVEEKVSDADPF